MIRILSILLVLLIPFSHVPLARADGPRIGDLQLKGGKGNITVSFRVEEGFTRDIKEAILSGMPTTFTFFIKVQRKRTLWWDEEVGSFRFRHTVRYDNLKEEFTVTLEEDKRDVKVKDIDAAKDLMVRVKDFSIPVRFQDGKIYYIKTKAELKTIRLPFPLRYIFFFVSFLEFKTDWYEKVFTYKDGRLVVIK